MSDDAFDRDAIVARRAVLVTSALAALSCSSPERPNPDTAVETVAVPLPGSAPTATSSAAPREPAADSWAAVMQGAPPLDVPAPASGVGEPERKALEGQSTALRGIYDELGKTWDKGPPGCAPDACEAEWAATSKQIANLVEGMRGPLCGWSDEQPISYIERDRVHRAFIQAQATALGERWAKAAAKADQTQAWNRIRQGNVVMHPCLSCLAPPPRIFDRIQFGDGAADIDAAGTTVLERVKQFLTSNATMRLAIRGHADPAEPGDKAGIAKRRAEAVRAWLTRQGIAQSRLEIVALGDAVPIASSKGSDRGENRRVDFERAR